MQIPVREAMSGMEGELHEDVLVWNPPWSHG